MSVGFEIANGAKSANDADGILSFAFDAGTGANRCLWVWASDVGDLVGATVTYAGQSMTLIDNTYNSNLNGLWYLQNPASGSNTLTLTTTSPTNSITLCAAVTNNTKQSGTPYSGLATANGNSTTHTGPSITATTDELIMWFDCSGNSISSPSRTSATIQNLDASSAVNNTAIQYTAGTGSSINATWAANSDLWFIVGLKILAQGDTGAVVMDNFVVAASGTVFNPTATRMKEVGFVTNTTAGLTSAITVAAGGVPAGDFILIRGSCDNTGASGAATTISVADNSSQSGAANTYTLQTPQAIADPGTASAGQQGFMVTCLLTRALLAGDVITITYGNSTAAKAINAQHYTGVNKTAPVFGYARQDNQTGQAVSLSAQPTQIGQTVATLVAVEGGTADTFSQDADTTDGTWTTITRRGSGTTTSGATNNSADKKVTGLSAQSYGTATMLGTARDHCAAIIVIDNAINEGTAAITLDEFAVSASGDVSSGASGTVAITMANFAVAASGTVTNPTISGTAAITLDNFTVSAAGAEKFVASAAIVLNDFVVSASGAEKIVASAAIVLDNFAVAASGSYVSPPVTGSAAITLDNFTVSGTGTEKITGSAAIVLDNFVVAASGAPKVVGSAAIVLDNFSMSATGAEKIVASAAIVLSNFTVSGAGTEKIDGSAAITLSNFTVAASGAEKIVGSAAIVLSNFTVAASGAEKIVGSAAIVLDNFIVSAASSMDTSGTVAITLNNFTVAATGAVKIVGSAAIALDNFTVAASGSSVIPPVTGSAAIVLNGFTVAATGTEKIVGSAAIVLNGFTVSATGVEKIVGSAAIALDSFAVSATGAEAIVGSAAIILSNFSVDAEGLVAGLIGFIKYWGGSSWIQKPAQAWTGTEWVEKPVKVWNGLDWVTIA